ncbi:hypothetical protein ACE38W_22540 [Chitinophaga sp. Hz27]|uniref:DUF6630 family protein n=1 Tax=Chitinophaga sp. Hz27 TaxID=3347169 RepID=UPI0035DDC8CF
MPVDILKQDFDWLTSTYGKINGSSVLDSRENVTHEIFPDKVIIGTAFVNCATYQVYFDGPDLEVNKFALENPANEDSPLVADPMTDIDTAELQSRWNDLLKNIRAKEKLQGSGNARQALSQLFYEIFEEDQAILAIDELSEFVKPDPGVIWEELAVALQNNGNLAEFEWSDLTDTGIYALNELEPIQLAGIVLDVPSEEDYEDIVAAEDFAQAALDYVNMQLEEAELKIVAVGTALDEFQAFTCLSVADQRFSNAIKHMAALCLVTLY